MVTDDDLDRFEHIDIRVSPNVAAVLSVRVTKDLAISLDEEARALGVPMSEVIRRALEHRHGPWTGGSLAVNVDTRAIEAEAVARQLAQSAEALRAVNAAHQIEVSYHYERMDCSCGWQAGIRDYSQPEGDQWIERDWQNDHFLPLLLAPDSTGARES